MQNLEKYGFIEASPAPSARAASPSAPPTRSPSSGLAELRDWLSELLSVPEDERGGFVTALSEAGSCRPMR